MEREEALPQEEEAIEPEATEDTRSGGSLGTVPMVQAVLCVLVLLAAAFLKYDRPAEFEKYVAWYHAEQRKVIELPGFDVPASSPTPAPEAEGETLLSI